MKSDSNLRTLELQRQKKNKLNRKIYLETDQRLLELEEDMLRVIEMCLSLEATVQYQEKIINRLLTGLAEKERRG
jgi:hypothetical protein